MIPDPPGGPRVRVGAVPFLNARPLVFGLEQGLGRGRIDLSYDVPSVLAERMAASDLDVALLPTIELARIPDLTVVPGLSISTRGPAASVLLVSRKPIAEIRSVALDPDSRTSNALVQILFAEVWGSDPSFTIGPSDLGRSLLLHDAAVRIGDKALFEPLPPGTQGIDLGEAWTVATGLPLVFAVWAARTEALDRTVYEVLHASRRQGTKVLDLIALDYTWRGVQYPEKSLDYLTRNIFHRLGAPEVASLRKFLAAARRAGITEDEPEIRLAAFGSPACGAVAAGPGRSAQKKVVGRA